MRKGGKGNSEKPHMMEPAIPRIIGNYLFVPLEAADDLENSSTLVSSAPGCSKNTELK